ncbi:MAG: hypothetical protein ACSHX5_02505 [Phycisphaerales bacterium]
MTTVTRPVHFAVNGKRKRIVREPEPEQGEQGGQRVPRISKLMALAIRYDQLLKDGVMENQSELALLAQVTQPRMTQIMNLLHLCPLIQEEILDFNGSDPWEDRIHEHGIREVVSLVRWSEQVLRWEELKSLHGEK